MYDNTLVIVHTLQIHSQFERQSCPILCYFW